MGSFIFGIDQDVIQIKNNTDVEKMELMNCWNAMGALDRPNGLTSHL